MKKIALLLAGGLVAPLLAVAGPADYVYTPAVEYGEKEIDLKFGSARAKDEHRESAGSIGFGYGATEWWFTELYVKYKRENAEGTKYDAFEWENKFQLTETGKYPVDVGFLVEIERPRDRAEGYELKWGPLFQTEFGKVQLNANFLFERSYRTRLEEPTQLNLLYQWQAKYRWLPMFEYGLQGMGELGKWSHWANAQEQTHKMGPAVFGKIPLGNRHAIKYNAAWLFGQTETTPKNTVRAQVEYEF